MGSTCDKARSSISSLQAHSSLAAQNILSVTAFNMQERETQHRLAYTKETFFISLRNYSEIRFSNSVMAITRFLSNLPSEVELHAQPAFPRVVKHLQQF